MGASAAFHLARRGKKVLGLEQFRIGHDKGSSHGETRLIRQAYFENPDYVPLLKRSYELWDELEGLSGEELFSRSGLVLFGNPGTSRVFQGTLESARLHSIPLEKLSHTEALKRFPQYQPPENFSALYEPGGGFLHAEKSIQAHMNQAIRFGAKILQEERFLGWRPDGAGVKVRTDRAEYLASHLLVCGGSWTSRILSDLKLPLTLRRMLLAWFRAPVVHSAAGGTPCFIFDMDTDFIYGFPMIDGKTVKIASHHGFEEMTEPEEKDSHPPAENRLESLREFIRAHLPHMTTDLERANHCIYTMTPDEDFVLDLHPEYPQVGIAGGFSGHGFKFSSVVGEVMADLCQSGRSNHPVGFLSLRRFERSKRGLA